MIKLTWSHLRIGKEMKNNLKNSCIFGSLKFATLPGMRRLTILCSFGVLGACGGNLASSTHTETKTSLTSGGIEEETREDEAKLKELEVDLFGLEEQSCQKNQVKVCLDYKGGDACYAKYGCEKSDLKDSISGDLDLNGVTFGNWYKDNYSKVAAETKKIHQGAFGCAATASTALKLYGYSIIQKKVTNEIESQLIKKGWTAIKDMKKLKKGDVVFTDKATSNIPGTYSHVYVFQYYEGNGFARITDNNGNLILRNIGTGQRSKSVIAYRK